MSGYDAFIIAVFAFVVEALLFGGLYVQGYGNGLADAECAAQCDGDWVRDGERCGCIGEGP